MTRCRSWICEILFANEFDPQMEVDVWVNVDERLWEYMGIFVLPSILPTRRYGGQCDRLFAGSSCSDSVGFASLLKVTDYDQDGKSLRFGRAVCFGGVDPGPCERSPLRSSCTTLNLVVERDLKNVAMSRCKARGYFL